MKSEILAIAAALAMALPAHAEGDAAKGEKDFRKCKSCHAVIADDGTEIVKGGKTGPNLWGLPGRVAGSDEDFSKKYSKGLVAMGEGGLVWDEESFVKWLADPTKFMREVLDDSKQRSKMTFKLKKGAEDVWAYLVSVSPKVEESTEGSESQSESN